jgi:site-specific DNA-methyltransferase (adenine-specific)
MPHVIHNSEFVAWAKAEAEHGVKFHAVFCDPPYGIAFMGKEWDDVGAPAAFQAQVKLWGEALLPLLYPGALVLMFGGTRTWHRLAAGMEDAGFELWDTLLWLHGQGFPKGQDLSKLIDKQNENERNVIGHSDNGQGQGWVSAGLAGYKASFDITAPASAQSAPWFGHKTPQLKPAWEPCLAFRAPRCGSSYADVALEYGSGALNVDGARIGTGTGEASPEAVPNYKNKIYGKGLGGCEWANTNGRYPANLLLDETTAPMLDEQTGVLKSGELQGCVIPSATPNGHLTGKKPRLIEYSTADSGGASRFFYCAKASKSERNAGIGKGNNAHPCVKPVNLCKYLATLILPPSSVEPRRLLVPFSGSGSETIGALLAGWDDVTGVEMDAKHCKVARKRIAHALERSCSKRKQRAKRASTPPVADQCLFPEIAAFLSQPCEVRA